MAYNTVRFVPHLTSEMAGCQFSEIRVELISESFDHYFRPPTLCTLYSNRVSSRIQNNKPRKDIDVCLKYAFLIYIPFLNIAFVSLKWSLHRLNSSRRPIITCPVRFTLTRGVLIRKRCNSAIYISCTRRDLYLRSSWPVKSSWPSGG